VPRKRGSQEWDFREIQAPSWAKVLKEKKVCSKKIGKRGAFKEKKAPRKTSVRWFIQKKKGENRESKK